MYHFSAPSTSLKPSELLSLPLRLRLLVMYLPSEGEVVPGDAEGPGDRLKGDVEFGRGACSCDNAVVVAPPEGFVDVVIVRGCVGEGVCCCVVEEGEVALPCWIAEWARKAARKLARKGRWVGIVLSFMRIRFDRGPQGEEKGGRSNNGSTDSSDCRMDIPPDEAFIRFDPRCEIEGKNLEGYPGLFSEL